MQLHLPWNLGCRGRNAGDPTDSGLYVDSSAPADIAEIAVWMARIIESLFAEGALPDGHGQDGLYYD